MYTINPEILILGMYPKERIWKGLKNVTNRDVYFRIA